MNHIAGGGVHAEAGKGLRQAAGIVAQLRPGGGDVAPGVLMEQGNGRKAVRLPLGGELLFDLRADLSGGRRQLCRRSLFAGAAGGSGGRRFHSRFCRHGYRSRLRSGLGGHLRNGRGTNRLGRSRRLLGFGTLLPGEYLIRRLLPIGLVSEEAGETPLLLLRLRRSFLRPGGDIVQREIDLGSAALRCTHPHRLRSRRPDRRGLDRLLFRFRLILRPLPQLFPQDCRSQPQGDHQGNHQQKDKNGQRSVLREHRHKAHRQGAGNGAAGGKTLPGGPEVLQNSQRGFKFHLTQNHVEDAAQQQGCQQSTGHPQHHRAALVEEQNQRREHQGRACQPVAIAEKALEQRRKPVNENGGDAAVADKHTQCQHQQHNSPNLPAHRLLGRRRRRALFPPGCAFGCGAFSGCGGLLLCGGCHGQPPPFPGLF